MNNDRLTQIAKRLRYEILVATTKAGSGHPTSCLSSVELMTALFFNGTFRANLDEPNFPNNDRLIFSKGHAAPLLYALYLIAGKITQEDFYQLRQLNSNLEGHPTMNFPYTEVPTGSLGQGLSVGVGMAINAKYLDKLPYKTYVLLGDSELAEGSNYEAMQLASFYQLNNLIAIVDVNRLGQRGQTMIGHDMTQYQERWQSFGWNTQVVGNGHDFNQLNQAFNNLSNSANEPTVILARTYKGAGIDFLQDQPGWHGKVLNQEQLEKAINLLGLIDKTITQTPVLPSSINTPEIIEQSKLIIPKDQYQLDQSISPRQAYGDGLLDLSSKSDLIVLDAEVSNSTYSESFGVSFPNRFFEMFIAEQNMVSIAMGLARRGKKPFISTFGAFYSRAADQLRMAQYTSLPLVCVGTHAGISIGADGSSQMALEDISLFRSLRNSTVLYPADAQSARWMVNHSYNLSHITYLRLTRNNLPVIYNSDEEFFPGQSKVIRQSTNDQVTVFATGITLHEAIGAYNILKNQGIEIRVVDLYSIKPLDIEVIKWAATQTRHLIVVEDHYAQGGIGEAVSASLASNSISTKFKHLSVDIMPHSGTTQELLNLAQIDSLSIVKAVQEFV